MSSAEPRVSGKITAGALLSMLLMGVMHLPALPHQSDSAASLGRTKSIAETQHEIVMLLIKKKEYEKAASEANKIFDMKWPEDQESLLLKELLILSDQFLNSGQAEVGLRFINTNSKCFKKASSRIAILKEMGYLCKSLDQNDRALEYFQQARELEDKD
jgi:tetratricopeptide (TPR) repeat protein